ncbi:MULTISPECIES: CBS domain-containing protein [Cyanophyceae]|uniref:CBS domain-containing protein n=1 Tax=Leptolyngbya subtilissima DQ-A4 TaxID=2933933 RepID=A0ABV0K131_9CYAN|nr:CBS domain-containing protein [Nodosilinea sp. FACHB-141]MBD2111251.1 CBS domain-containing protein [Nodosilinea sp. FACHB-141]
MAKTVADVMTSNPISVAPDTVLKDAIQLMADNHVGGLPVINADNHLVGILSESDLMWQTTGVDMPAYIMLLDSVIYLKTPNQYNQELHKALGQLVKDVMTDHVVTIAPDKSLREAAHLMHDKQVRRLPVIDADKQVVGILTRGDIVREMANSYA